MVRWRLKIILVGVAFLCSTSISAWADPPALAYLFPAGGQRGTTVSVRVGGLNLYDKPFFSAQGNGLQVPGRLSRIPTVWFEGPLIKQPASQQKEDYPQDYAADFVIANDATLGNRFCRARTAQGITASLPFVIGNLPEVIEQEHQGDPLPVQVALPVTINGRIFPREDVDLWSFPATAGESLQLILATSEFQSPLEGLIEVLDPAGRVVAEATGQFRRDPQLRFTPASSGNHAVRVRDIRSSGLQNHVYRLTITAGPRLERTFPLGGRAGTTTRLQLTGLGLPAEEVPLELPAATGPQTWGIRWNDQLLNPVWFDVDQWEEVVENPAGNPALPLPGIANGIIRQPGEIDRWEFTATKGQALKLEIRAARLQSPLDAVLVVRDAAGKELARGDDLPNNSPDCEVNFTAPADGIYHAEVRERFATRGGEAFAYRLKATHAAPGLELTWDVDALAVEIGKTQKLSVKLQRSGGLTGAVTVSVMGLPDGVTAEPLVIAANQNQGSFSFNCHAQIPVSIAKLRLIARCEQGENRYETTGVRVDPEGLARSTELPLALTLPTPFRYRGNYELKYVSRGTDLRKTFLIERENYAGPLVMQLADRQGRHLQGVTAGSVSIPPEATECNFPVRLAPEMELGRTCRVNVMLLGEVADASGERYQVGFSTNEQNEQLIALVSPSLLRLIVEPNSPVVIPGEEVRLQVVIKRDPSIREGVQLELIPPAHQTGVAPLRWDVPADRDETELVIPLAANAGPFNAPWILRGTTKRNGEEVVTQSAVKPIMRGR